MKRDFAAVRPKAGIFIPAAPKKQGAAFSSGK